MARILYWNVNNFTRDKVFAAAPPADALRASDRLDHMQYILLGAVGGKVPDIIVLVEVGNRSPAVLLEGGVIDSGGNAGMGVLFLLDQLRAWLGQTWCVVPPLRLGEGMQREAVAVFYNAANLQFTGPNLFYDGWGRGIGQAQPVTARTLLRIINYPLAWMNGMPNPANPIPALALNRNENFMIGGVATPIPEYQLAGQWEYYVAPPPARPIPSGIQPPYERGRIFFPNPGCRGPFWVRFRDLAVPRTINLFAVHTSPGATARQGILQMETVPDMTAVAAGEVKVILGDFNVDSFGGDADAYDWMAAAPGHLYTMALDPRDAGAVVAARKPYCMTHFLPLASATPFNAVGVPAPTPQCNVYPRYGYMGSGPGINDSGAIDNFFTAYGAGAGGPAANVTVINTLVGTPFNALPAPPGVTAELTGGLPYPRLVANPIPLAPPPGGINPPPPAIVPWVDPINFQGWHNLGCVHSVSDHLPLMIEI
jgi:hypothetical protein